MRLGKRVGAILGWINKDSSMDSGSSPVTMSMPPHSPFLERKNQLLCEFSSWLDGALSDVCRTICPWVSLLLHSMPVHKSVRVSYAFD